MTMRHSIALILLGLLFAAPSTAAAQTIPQTIPGTGPSSPFGGLVRAFAGIEFIKAEIVDLRRELSRCDGPGASKAGACASRALLQAKLNYLLEFSMLIGDPDTAGAPPTPLARPAESSNYTDLENYLVQEIRKENTGATFYPISDNRAKYEVIQYCKAMKDPRELGVTFMTPEEVQATLGGAAAAKTRADVSACINEFDAKEISANRKTAMEYCMASTAQPDGRHPLLNLCMDRHDMLQAMCKRRLERQEAWRRHKIPQFAHAPQTCESLLRLVSQREIQAIQAAPTVRTMAELPPKFFAPPDVVIAPRPPLPIPSGTVIEVRIQGSWDGFAIDSVANNASKIGSGLDLPIVVGGKEVLHAPAGVILKGRIIGPGARPDTVQIGLTTDEVNVDAVGNYADLKSNELVFTVPYRANASNPGIRADTKLRFTIGGTGTVVTPPGQPAPASSAPTPPTTADPPPPPTGSKPPDPQQQADEIRKQAERRKECAQQAMRDNPRGGLELAQALGACAKTN
jgi:hypothetical protein